jgi:phospholipid/cholesterol/gamma-HCH transport system substrate-binding protein
MSDRKLQIQVGLLFLLSIIVVVMGILWFKEFKIGGRSYPLVVEFPNTSGLARGDEVEVKGVTSGKVEAIRFEEGRALVFIQLDRGVELYNDAQFSIESIGLMGEKAVTILPGTRRTGVLPPGSTPKGEYHGGVTELMTGVGGALDTFERLATRLDSLLVGFDRPKQDQVGRTLDNLERATREMANLLEENRTEIAHSVRTMGDAMEDLHAMLDGHEDSFGQAIEGARSTTAHMDSTLVNLNRTVNRMDSLLVQVQSGEGTLGRVIEDEALYDEFVATLGDAKALLQDVRQNPKRYFKFSVF